MTVAEAKANLEAAEAELKRLKVVRDAAVMHASQLSPDIELAIAKAFEGRDPYALDDEQRKAIILKARKSVVQPAHKSRDDAHAAVLRGQDRDDAIADAIRALAKEET